MAEYVTGPSTGGKKATFPRAAHGVATVYIDPAWSQVRGLKWGAEHGPDADRARASSVIRAGMNDWNIKGTSQFREVFNPAHADIIVAPPRESEHLFRGDQEGASGMGEYPHPGPEHLFLQRHLDPTIYDDAKKWLGFHRENVSHELGHTQGLKHRNMSRTAGVMRYGLYLPGAGREKNKPTEGEVRKVIQKQGRTIPSKLRKDRSNPTAPQGGTASRKVPDFGGLERRKTDPGQTLKSAKPKKPSKPAHERKVTGSHKVMQ